jgi:hypothetical protein
MALVVLLGHYGGSDRRGSPFLRDVPVDQRKEAVVEIGIRNRFPSHDAEHFGRTRRHGNRSRSDSRARRLLHFLQLALLSTCGDENDARAIAIVGAAGLQTHRDVHFLLRLVIPRAGQDSRFAGSLQHVSLTQKCALDAPANRVTRTGNRLTELSRPGESSSRIVLGSAASKGHRGPEQGHEAGNRNCASSSAHDYAGARMRPTGAPRTPL